MSGAVAVRSENTWVPEPFSFEPGDSTKAIRFVTFKESAPTSASWRFGSARESLLAAKVEDLERQLAEAQHLSLIHI